MKRRVLLCSALFLFSVPAIAQEESNLYLLASGGLSLPQNPDPFKDGWSNGFNVGGGAGYRFSRHLAVQALVNYDRFPFDEQGLFTLFTEEFGFDPRDFGLAIDVQGAETSVLSISGELKASFVGNPSKVSPYLIGGVGMSHLSIGDTTFSDSFMGVVLVEQTVEGESVTKGMATTGAGVDISISERVGVLVEGRYQFVFADERTDFASFRGGVRIGL